MLKKNGPWKGAVLCGKKAGGIHSNLPDPSHRSKKPTPKDFGPKGGADSPHLSWLRKGEIFCVYTDSWYAYAILHAHGTVWEEKGMLTVENKRVKHGLSILKLLEAVQLPKEMAVFHCRGHQKGVQR